MDTIYFSAKGLTVGYDGVPLIQDITFTLEKGEILTLIGPNGAGKTTILKHIIRQMTPLGGTVMLEGRDLQQISGTALSQKMAVVLTERIRPEWMTCEDVVAMGRYPYTGRFGTLTQADRRIVEETMELVHISHYAKRDFRTVSDGQRQRVMLARALCQEPEILVLDEPTSFLDIRYKLEFLSILQKLSRERRLTVILSLHELELAGRISDKIACVKGNHIDRFGTPESVFVPGYLSKLYGLTLGSYEECTGNLELERGKGQPDVFVLAGNGSGTPAYRRLQRAGIPFATGILWENDLDYPVANALASEVISVKPFCSIPQKVVRQAKEKIDACRSVVCALDTGENDFYSPVLQELVSYALSLGKLQQK